MGIMIDSWQLKCVLRHVRDLTEMINSIQSIEDYYAQRNGLIRVAKHLRNIDAETVDRLLPTLQARLEKRRKALHLVAKYVN